MALARLLVQGVDVWLNNPRRPEEASGTSGMKAGLNGVLNLSVLDGWWSEGYEPELGWAIPAAVSEQGDEAEADELLRLLEEEVVPAFYERDAGGRAAALDADAGGVDRRRRRALHRRPDGRRVRGAALPPRAPRRPGRREEAPRLHPPAR